METKYQSIRDYIAARKRGDRATTDRIVREVGERFATRTTEGTEIRDLGLASMTVPFDEEA